MFMKLWNILLTMIITVCALAALITLVMIFKFMVYLLVGGVILVIVYAVVSGRDKSD